MPTHRTPLTATHTPWIWLQAHEPSRPADGCACRLDATGPNEQPGAAFYMCPAHEQALAMISTLRETLSCLEGLEHEHQEAALVRGIYEPSNVTRIIPKIRRLLAATL